jgi:glutaminyl-peptide cyclotransferase
MDAKNRNRRVLGFIGAVVLAWLCGRCTAAAENVGTAANGTKPQAVGAAVKPSNPLDAQRAYGYLLELCAFGPRPSGSAAMQKQQAMLENFFKKLGGNVTLQRFPANDPRGGEKVAMVNIIVEWHPERKERILLCTHYDTRPQPDNDPDPSKRRNGIFIGANDGASGVAVLMELAHLMPKLDGPLGVDYVFLDGEELVYVDRRDPYCLGATWFAQQYSQKPPGHKYRWGVLLDMVGDANLQLYQEHYSATWLDTRPLVKGIWATAERLGVKEFLPRAKYLVSADDHMPLRNVGKIPTCDVIDFVDSSGTPPPATWHTTKDDPQHCAPSSLAKVGWVVYEWLKSESLGTGTPSKAAPQGAHAVKSAANPSP